MEDKDSKNTAKLYNLEEILAATAVGAISFPLALGAIQNFVFKPLRISCKNPNALVLAFGGASVIMAGAVASDAFVGSCEGFRRFKLLSNTDRGSRKRFEFEFGKTDENILMYGIGSLAVFKCFGGKVRYVVPSHLFYPGAFARVSIPASGKNYATLSAKRKLYILGRRYGCHSCGKRRQKEFIADHMPPNKLVKFYQSQEFYPQCKPCSLKQGVTLSSLTKVSPIQTHATTLRIYHLWLPVPLGIAIVKNLSDGKKNQNGE